MADGVVKFFLDKKGWGFIQHGETHDVFVHYADIEGDGYRSLAKGDSVRFEIVDGPKGDKAVNVIRVEL